MIFSTVLPGECYIFHCFSIALLTILYYRWDAQLPRLRELKMASTIRSSSAASQNSDSSTSDGSFIEHYHLLVQGSIQENAPSDLLNMYTHGPRQYQCTLLDDEGAGVVEGHDDDEVAGSEV